MARQVKNKNRISPSEFSRRARSIQLIAMDVDGVLTRGEVVVLDSGEEVKFWNAKDRLGLALLRDHVPEITVAWITGRKSNAVALAAKDLGVPFVIQRCKDKKQALENILKSQKISAKNAVFIGDDLIDLPAIKIAGLSICPADAVPDVKNRVNWVSPHRGGEGVVRDVLENVLRAKGKWDKLISKFY